MTDRDIENLFEEGTLIAHSNRIVALIDEDVEVEIDEEIAAILASANL